MGAYLIKKNLNERFCLDLINAEYTNQRRGFLHKSLIRDVIVKNGMPVINKQVELLTKELTQDMEHNYSYLEMIALLFGEYAMEKIRREHEINIEADAGDMH